MSAALDRLTSGYYNPGLRSNANPGGLSGVGAMRDNWPLLQADVAAVGTEAADSAASAIAAAAAAVQAPGTSATSTTEITIPGAVGGTLNFIIQEAGKLFIPGQTLLLAPPPPNALNSILIRLTAFDAVAKTASGLIEFKTGVGTFSSWRVSLAPALDDTLTGRTSALEQANAALRARALFIAKEFLDGTYLGVINKTGSAALATIVAAPAAGKMRRVDLSATNIDGALQAAGADVYIVDAGDGANTGYRKKRYPLPATPNPASTVILEAGLILKAGQSIQVKAAVADTVAFSAEVDEADADPACLGIINKTGTTGFVQLVAAPAAGLVRRVDLTVCNITVGDTLATADVKVVDALNAQNTGLTRNAFPVPPPPDEGCAAILHFAYRLKEGQSLEIRASAANAVAFSAEVVEIAADA